MMDVLCWQKTLTCRPSDVGQGMLVCGGVAVDLLEFVFGDLLTLVIIQLWHKPFVDVKRLIRKSANWFELDSFEVLKN